jgi:hypothetical protein
MKIETPVFRTDRHHSKRVCNCYVVGLDAITQYELRWGAHAETCPAYRPSADPVNNQRDSEIRAHYSSAS